MDFLQKPDLFDLADTFPLLRDGHRAPGHVSPPGANLPTNKIAGASCVHYLHTKIIIAGVQGWIYDDQNLYYDDILEFNPVENALVPLGHMTQARGQHAISVVQTMDYAQWQSCHIDPY